MNDIEKMALRRQQGWTYQQIGDEFGIDHSRVWGRLKHNGLLVRCNARPQRRIVSEADFWQAASTILALIRAGHNTYRAIARGLGYRSKSAAYRLVQRMRAMGLVESTPKCKATLHLTEKGQRMGSLVVLAQRHPDGTLEWYKDARNGASGFNGARYCSERRITASKG